MRRALLPLSINVSEVVQKVCAPAFDYIHPPLYAKAQCLEKCHRESDACRQADPASYAEKCQKKKKAKKQKKCHKRMCETAVVTCISECWEAPKC